VTSPSSPFLKPFPNITIQQPLKAPGLGNTFACNCTDCHKVCQTQAVNFIVSDPHLKYLRGRDNITIFSTNKTTTQGNDMANYFCKTCGTLMNRVSSGFPGANFLRTGTVDDFTLQSTVLKPQHEIFTKSRLDWIKPIEGAKQHEAMPDW
jgi:hypothetical protein